MLVRRSRLLSGIKTIFALFFIVTGFIWPLQLSANNAEPTLASIDATNINSTYATLNGELVSDGSSIISEHGFYYGLTLSCESEKKAAYTGIGDDENFYTTVTDLKPNTRYYFKAYAKNDQGIGYGNTLFFRTDASNKYDEEPLLTTHNASDIGEDHANLNAHVSPYDRKHYNEPGFYFGTDSDPVDSGVRFQASKTGEGDFSVLITGLDLRKKYYFAACAKNSNGTVYGDVKSFTTGQVSNEGPEVTTGSTIINDNTYATISGRLDTIGSDNISEYGFYFGTDLSCSGKLKVGSSADEGAIFLAQLTRLIPDTHYYYKAYAENDYGTSYGNILSFRTTGSGLP